MEPIYLVGEAILQEYTKIVYTYIKDKNRMSWERMTGNSI